MGALLQIILLALQEIPLAANTFKSIRELLSRDPAIPLDLRKILADTAIDNAETIARAQVWLAAHPDTPPQA